MGCCNSSHGNYPPCVSILLHFFAEEYPSVIAINHVQLIIKLSCSMHNIVYWRIDQSYQNFRKCHPYYNLFSGYCFWLHTTIVVIFWFTGYHNFSIIAQKVVKMHNYQAPKTYNLMMMKITPNTKQICRRSWPKSFSKHSKQFCTLCMLR